MEILFIDDEIDILESIKSILKPTNFKCTFITNISEGFSVFKKNHFDVVVTDIKMPGLDGIEFVRKIREIDKKVKIIIMTGYFEISLLLKLINSQIYLLSKKPLYIREIIMALCEIEKELNINDKKEFEYQKLIKENKKLKSIIKNISPDALDEYINK
jgi:DNA-binding NtrC family response regulator